MMAAPFTRYGDAVERYVNLGYLPIPIRPNEKRPAVSDWTNLSPARAISIALQHREAGIGVRTGSLAPLDVDVRNSNVATDLHQYIRRMIIQNAPELVRYGNPPKFLVLCQAEKAGPKRTSPLYRDSEGIEHRIECMGEGQQVVLAGIHPDTNEPYFWAKGDPLDQDVAVYELPVLTEEQWHALVDYFCRLAEAQGWERVSNERSAAQQGDADPTYPVAGLTLDIAREALSCVPNDDLPYDEWLDVGMALHQQGKGEVDWFQLWDDWSTASSKYGGSRYNWKRWESFSDDRPGGITMRSVLMRAEDNGWTRPDSVEGARVEQEEMFENLDQQVSGAPDSRATKFFPELTFPGEWGDYAPPPQEWAWDQLVPMGEATLLYALGGTGKTRLVQQLATAIATGAPFLGNGVTKGTVIMLLCEDDRDQVIRRQDAIERNGGPTRQEIGENVVMLPRKGKNNLLMVFDRHGNPRRTEVWNTLAKLCLLYKDTLSMLFIDTLSDVFGGNEMDRGHSRQMIQQACVSIAQQCHCAVLLAAHPSLNSVTAGRGMSGSTGWEGAVRSRLYMHPDEERDGLILLDQPKTNLGVKQDQKMLRMVDGYLVEVAGEEEIESTREVECRSDLLRILYSVADRGYELTDSPKSDRCFWKVALREQRVTSPAGTQWKRQDYELALDQLVQRGVIELVKTRPDREAREVRIVPLPPAEEAEG